ncbi:hypothetical protein DXG03_008421 [Asterophora parasitica]|uniref:Uncharacterized protein n=1 Tax=Asterophora parasitica TaxID=117018 RepID=A0A9P7KEM1_9AGAR|nr:hypothetical protein DXG03_008421 [Asterophora parasitica]
MSTWNLGANDVSEQEQAFKDKLASKDGHISALQSKLMKQEQELHELKDAYDEKLRKVRAHSCSINELTNPSWKKLSDETSRALKLESELHSRSDSLRNEKIGAQNTSQALTAAKQTIKEKEAEARQLEASLDSLSHLSDTHKARADRLQQEKTTLETRVRELQTVIPQPSLPPRTPGHRRTATRSRSRSPSPSRCTITALEKELANLRSALSQKEVDVDQANAKASHAQEEAIRLGNEKTALEKKLTRQLAEVKESLQEKEEELRDMQGMMGDGGRERELEQRIEEDEAKILALEHSFRADEAKLRREVTALTGKLKEKSRRVVEAEERHIELIREKEEALDEFENARRQISTLTETLRLKEAEISRSDTVEATSYSNEDRMEIDDDAAANVQRLLNAIERLRLERDQLRTSFDFLQNESKFEIEALNARLVAASDATTTDYSAETIDQLRTEVAALSSRLTATAAHEAATILAKETEIRQLGLAITASALVIQHLQCDVDLLEQRDIDTHSAFTELESRLVATQRNLADVETSYKDLQASRSLDASSAHAELERQLTAAQQSLVEAETNLSEFAALEKRNVDLGSAHTDLERQFVASQESLAGEENKVKDTQALELQIADARSGHEELQRQLVAAQHSLTEAETKLQDMEALKVDADSARIQLQDQLAASRNLSELEVKLKDLEDKLDITVRCLQTTTSERDNLLSQLADRDSDLEQASQDHAYFKQQLANVEAERNSLTLQLAHIDSELKTAQNELKAAEARYSDLQFHQMDAMKPTEATRRLQAELHDERERVKRRDGHIAMRLHDIQRLETNIRLQEDRLAEMAEEVELVNAAKEAMVDDCADARDARDRALERLESMELELETRLEEGNCAIEALVHVVLKTVASARDRIRIESQGARSAKEAFSRLKVEHEKLLRVVQDKEALRESVEETGEAFRQSTVALAVSQVGLRKALAYIRETVEEKDILQREIQSQQNDLDRESTERENIASQLNTLEHQASAAALDFANRTTEFEKQIQCLQRTISESDVTHRVAVEELIRSKEHLKSTLDQTQKSLVESTSNDGMARLREQHTLELNETRAQLSESQRSLADLRSSHAATMQELETSLANALEVKQELEVQMVNTSESLQQSVLQLQEAEQKRDALSQDVSRFQKELDGALSQVRELEVNWDNQQSSLDRASKDLMAAKERQDGALAKATEEHTSIQQRLKGELADLQTKLDDKSRMLDDAVQESTRLTRLLEEEVSNLAADKEGFEKELSDLDMQRHQAETALEELRQSMEATQTGLDQSNQELDTVQQEKSSLQESITAFEAEIQRSASLCRFLESQVKDSEAKVNSVMEELEQTRAELARSEKAAKAAEMNFTLQGAQHKREMSDLNRQITALRSQPNLQNVLAELEERNNEMEELLRNKCAEIEENDDRALEMLKENKKLNTKVESLTRKVQNLQTKLTAAKASIQAPPPVPTPSSFSAPDLIPGPSSGSKNPTSRPRSTTLINAPSTSAAPPVPPLPTNISAAPFHAPPPASRTPTHRAVSGPSSLPRPKTPERKSFQPPPAVFKARTPERRTVSSPPEASSSSITIGKKRRAPDDFEGCESLPPQGFTADSLPSREMSEDTSNTPRVRRVLNSFQSGFTPVRNQGRPMMSMPSPKRLMMGSNSASPVILDVTNSPRGQSAKSKRSWLGKIRGASSSQSSSRPMDGRPRFDRETS